MEKLFERIHQIELDLDPDRTGKIFNVLGDMFPANELEKMLRSMYARNLTEDVIKDRIIEQVDRAHVVNVIGGSSLARSTTEFVHQQRLKSEIMLPVPGSLAYTNVSR